MVRSTRQSWARENKSYLMDKQADTYYNVFCEGRKIYSNLTEEEYFETMEDLAAQFYQTGSPNPSDLDTEIIRD